MMYDYFRQSLWHLLPIITLASLTSGIKADDPFKVEEITQFPYVENQVIVKFREQEIQSAEAISIQQSLGASTVKTFPMIRAQLWELNSINTVEAVQRLENDSRIEYIEPNYIISLKQTPNDPEFSQLWGLHNEGQTGGTVDADIDAPEAWELKTESDVVVAVIDTGVDYNHPDLAANMWVNQNEIPDNGIDDDGNGCVDDVYGCDFVNDDGDPFDDHFHGTHVAGTIAAVGNNNDGIVGVSWTAKIMAIKFLSGGGSGTIADAISAVQYATHMGAQISNNSWGGGGYSQALYDAIQVAGEEGILFVAAAGNYSNNNDAYPSYPASYDLDNIIAVAATDHHDNLAGFSNYGLTTVDLGAPGVNIYSTMPNNNYSSLSGTSMAAPHVSGAISLLWAKCSKLTHTQVKQNILETVDNVPALSGKTVTGGRLNVFHALQKASIVCGGSCTHAVYSVNKQTLTVPFIEIPLIDFLTGQPTGELETWQVVLKLVNGKVNRLQLRGNPKPIIEGSSVCPATYSLETGTLFIPYVDVPTHSENEVEVFEATLIWEPLGKSFVVQQVDMVE
jgi:hypothetical protein